MTITTDPPTVAEAEAQIEPGTLCFIRTEMEAPPGWQNKRSLAVYAGGHGAQRWMMLIPNDGTRDAEQVGWRIGNQVTSPVIERLNLRRFMSTHRGWWLGQAEFLETCTGHWCVAHQAFHATPTCPPEMAVAPPSDEPERLAHTARIAELERQLAEAREANEVLVREHQAFIVKASDILGEEADSHDLCEVYDSIARDAGLLPRVSQHDVEIEVTYRQTVTVRQRTWEEAVEVIKGKAVSTFFTPPTPFVDNGGIEDYGSTYSISVEVIND